MQAQSLQIKEIIAREIKRRSQLLDGLFEQQKTVVQSPATRKAVQTSRRSGKTFMCISYAAHVAQSKPNSRCAYIALTRPSAEDLAWPILNRLDEDYGLDWHFLDSKLTVCCKNGSTIKLYGADQKNWIRRLRGAAWDLVIIDEAAEFDNELLQQLCYQIIEPTLIDRQGTLVLIGTPGMFNTGLFYDITQGTGKAKGWDVHRWGTSDNPYMKSYYEAKLAEHMAGDPDVVNQPWFRREYFGEWVEDNRSDMVYHWDEVKNGIRSWEPAPGDQYVLGVDFGFRDSVAFCLASYSSGSPNLFIVDAWKSPSMWTDAIAAALKDYIDRYPGVIIYGDPSRISTLEELSVRYGIPILKAEKQNKYDRIRAFNTDLTNGYIKVLRPEDSQLVTEMKQLMTKQLPSGAWIEHPGLPNDICDATLYAHHASYHYRFEPPDDKPKPGTPEYWQDKEARLIKSLEARQKLALKRKL